MNIKRSGSQPSSKGPAEYFSGTVRIDPLFQANDPSRGSGAYVTFEPGARTAWHSHPLGQTLIVTAGCGLVQRWGGPVEEIRPGDVVWIPLVRNIGMAPRRPLPLPISPYKNNSTAKSPSGWKGSVTTNSAGDFKPLKWAPIEREETWKGKFHVAGF